MLSLFSRVQCICIVREWLVNAVNLSFYSASGEPSKQCTTLCLMNTAEWELKKLRHWCCSLQAIIHQINPLSTRFRILTWVESTQLTHHICLAPKWTDIPQVYMQYGPCYIGRSYVALYDSPVQRSMALLKNWGSHVKLQWINTWFKQRLLLIFINFRSIDVSRGMSDRTMWKYYNITICYCRKYNTWCKSMIKVKWVLQKNHLSDDFHTRNTPLVALKNPASALLRNARNPINLTIWCKWKGERLYFSQRSTKNVHLHDWGVYEITWMVVKVMEHIVHDNISETWKSRETFRIYNEVKGTLKLLPTQEQMG